MVTSISSGEFSFQYVSGVPHFEQKVRTTGVDERNSVGGSAVNLNSRFGNVTHPSN